MTPAARVLRGGVRAYQLVLSPVLGGQCRFFPSCSAYAMDALAAHGAVHGSALAARRILRCHPWNEGGYDPVPPSLHFQQSFGSPEPLATSPTPCRDELTRNG